jgi:hypothetical protein
VEGRKVATEHPESVKGWSLKDQAYGVAAIYNHSNSAHNA